MAPLRNLNNDKFVIFAKISAKDETEPVGFAPTRAEAEAKMASMKALFPNYSDWKIVELGN